MEKYTIGGISVARPGHATVIIFSGDRVIYIDPFILPENPPIADLILITHSHYDHCDPVKIKDISDERTKIIAARSCLSKIAGNVVELSPGKPTIVGDMKIKAVEAYNIGKHFHTKGLGVGYIIDTGGVIVYHAGDTDKIPEMKYLESENIDIAFLPIGGTYTMNIEEAAVAVSNIKPKVVVPIHYGTIEGTDADPEEFRKLVELKAPGVQVKIL